VSGVIDEVEGLLHALYVDPSQNAGILKGTFSGSVYPDIQMWDGFGSAYPMQMATAIGVSPDTLGANVEQGLMGGWLAGDFGGSGSSLYSDLTWGRTLSIKGHGDWGVYDLSFGFGNDFKNPAGSTTWSARAGGWAWFGSHDDAGGGTTPEQGVWMTSSPITGTLNGNLLKASYAGEYLTYASTGTLSGEFLGTADAAQGGWQAKTGGYWSGGQPLAFNGAFDGDMTTEPAEPTMIIIIRQASMRAGPRRSTMSRAPKPR